jgi:hypothetical protein
VVDRSETVEALDQIAGLDDRGHNWFTLWSRRRSSSSSVSGGFREPDRHAPALVQGEVISRPIRHPVPLLGDVMTAIVVRFEWHGDCPRLETGPTSYTLHSSPPTDRSVQQGREIVLHLYMKS